MTRTRNSYRLASFWLAGTPARVVEPDGPEPVAEQAPATSRLGELRHGYTLADLHSLARLAVHTAGAMASNWHDRHETAWSAIAEHLYTVDERPARHDLVRVGQLAIYAVVDDDRHHHGYYKRKTIGAEAGPCSSPNFLAYWWEWVAHNFPSCEATVVERASLVQIWPALTETQRDALLALAVHDDYQAAAESLGMGHATFRSHIARGRNRFLALWHEGEIPSKTWGVDRRAGQRAGERRTGGGRLAMEAIRRRSRMSPTPARSGEAA